MGEISLDVSFNDSFDNFLKPSWFSRVQDGNGVSVSGSSVINGLMNVGTISWFSKNSLLLLHQIMEVGQKIDDGKGLVFIYFQPSKWFVGETLWCDPYAWSTFLCGFVTWKRKGFEALRCFFGLNADKGAHSVSKLFVKISSEKDL